MADVSILAACYVGVQFSGSANSARLHTPRSDEDYAITLTTILTNYTNKAILVPRARVGCIVWLICWLGLLQALQISVANSMSRKMTDSNPPPPCNSAHQTGRCP